MIKEIPFKFDNFSFAEWEDKDKATGLTIILNPKGMKAGVCIAGGGPASRETPILEPTKACEKINGVVLSGGSAFGLDAAGGVMDYCFQNNIGLDTGFKKIPLVVSSCIFDCCIGDINAFPTKEDALKALENLKETPAEGSVGAGCGASVGKLLGMDNAMGSGQGIFAVQNGDLKMGAIMIVNALGDVLEDGQIIAGLNKDGKFLNSRDVLFELSEDPSFFTNTTIGAVITNGDFNKTELTKIAQMAQDGMARAISPVHTSNDGDSIYVLSDGNIKASVDTAGTLAAYVVEKAIIRAVKNAKNKYLRNYSD